MFLAAHDIMPKSETFARKAKVGTSEEMAAVLRQGETACFLPGPHQPRGEGLIEVIVRQWLMSGDLRNVVMLDRQKHEFVKVDDVPSVGVQAEKRLAQRFLFTIGVHYLIGIKVDDPIRI